MILSRKLTQSTPSNIRPINTNRDLLAVADLVEQCFESTLDRDGRSYIRQMRRSAYSNPGGRLLEETTRRLNVPVFGFIWEEDSKVVGNLSLMPVRVEKKRSYLIANVAVYPEYRRRGIAKELTIAAIDHLRRKGIGTVWLQVREDNPPAQTLYKNAGFSERARRTTWHSSPAGITASTLSKPKEGITSRRAADWPTQEKWLQQVYPPWVTWHLSLSFNLLASGFWGSLQRVFSERAVRQWSLRQGGHLLGVLSWQSSRLQADKLWLATSLEAEETAIRSLLPHAATRIAKSKTLSLNYPAGRGTDAFYESGFFPHNTLIWMERKLVG
jgi:ribosomal protein S18 acetylase RimI-like enzyme